MENNTIEGGLYTTCRAAVEDSGYRIHSYAYTNQKQAILDRLFIAADGLKPRGVGV